MITHEDIDFHLPEDGDLMWAETNWFAFAVPEARLLCCIYALSRKTVGSMSVEVAVSGAMCDTRSELLHIDSRHMLPVVDKLSDFTTANDLSIRATSERNYSLRYSGYDDFSFDVEFEGLHEPFDIHDPRLNPKVSQDRMGQMFGGHFELNGHVTGTMTLRGETYDVDCIETMDHSWGPRPEIFISTMGWSHAHFGRGLQLKWVVTTDLDAPVGSQQQLAYGFVVEDGEVFGVTGGTFVTHRVGSLITGMEVSLTDVRGQTYDLRGIGEVAMPVLCSSPTHVSVSDMRWSLADGRTGRGIASDYISLQELSRRHGRRWSDLPRRYTS